jgi:chromosome segregation ATPase
MSKQDEARQTMWQQFEDTLPYRIAQQQAKIESFNEGFAAGREAERADAEAALAECAFRCKKEHVPVATMNVMVKQVIDLENKLAECERQREMHRKANQELDASRTNLIHQMDNADARIADLERKLAAAREATTPLVKYIPQLLQDYRYTDVPGIWLPYKTWQAILAALTEAGDGRK